MSKVHIRYLIVALVLTVGFGALLAGWGHMLAAGIAGIMGGRAVGREYTDARMGKTAGIAVGMWAGLGCVLGSVVVALLAVALNPGAQVTLGAVLLLALTTAGISVFAAAVAGRESVKKLEEEA